MLQLRKNLWQSANKRRRSFWSAKSEEKSMMQGVVNFGMDNTATFILQNQKQNLCSEWQYSAVSGCRLVLLRAVKRAIEDLQQLGIVTEATGKSKNKVYIYKEYLDILNQDDGTFEAQ
jgi:phosphoserine aminotransferase